MSRVGKKPIEIPTGVQVELTESQVKVKGPKGELVRDVHPSVKIEKKDNELIISVLSQKEQAFWGLFRSLINNMVIGVIEGFEKKLEINGVGYKVAMQGKDLVLNVGYSHQVDFSVPESVTATVEKNIITITGIDKQQVGEVAANIRKIRKPEPYKGKGIKYVDEIIQRKVGKAAAKSE